MPELYAFSVAGVVLYRASPHPPRHFVVDVFLVLLVFLSVGLLYLPWEMFSKSMFFGCLPGFVVGVCFVLEKNMIWNKTSVTFVRSVVGNAECFPGVPGVPVPRLYFPEFQDCPFSGT